MRKFLIFAVLLVLPVTLESRTHSAVFPCGCQELRAAWLEQNGPVVLRLGSYNSLIVTYNADPLGRTGGLLFEPAAEGYSCRVIASGGPAKRVLRYEVKQYKPESDK